jgi:GT2 family glycosyltransferase
VVRASIIVVSWNGEAYLGECLNAILALAGPDDEVIVVDNASVDGSVALVRTRWPQVRLIENHRNLGFAGGCNTGLRVAQGDVRGPG